MASSWQNNLPIPSRRSSYRLSPCLLLNDDVSFAENLADYFRYRINNRPVDYVSLIRDAKRRFGRYKCKDGNCCCYTLLFREMLFSCFEITQCTDYNVIQRTLRGYMFKIMRDNSYYKFWERYYLTMDQSDLEKCPFYHDPWTNEKHSVDFFYSNCLVFNVKATRRLLRYGSRFELSPLQSLHSYYSILLSLSDLHLPVYFGRPVSPLINPLDLFPIAGRAYPTAEEKRRLYIVLLVLYATLRKLLPNPRCSFRRSCCPLCSASGNPASSLKLVFETIREPFVTVAEITRFLALCPFEEDEVAKLCSEVVKEFPKSTGPFAPRSLLHLSRCEVRNCMAKRRQLPHRVWGLEIPTELKHYILLQTRKREFFPIFVSALEGRGPVPSLMGWYDFE